MTTDQTEEGSGSTGARAEIPSGTPHLERALGFPAVLMQSVGLMAPTAALILAIQFIGGFAGIATPFAFIVAIVVMLLLAVTLSDIAKRLPSAGGYYTFIRAGLGNRAGLWVAILLLLYGLGPSVNAAFLGKVVGDELKAHYSITLPWPILFVLIILICGVVAYRGVKFSGLALIILGGIEVSVLLALGVWGLFDPGPGGLNLQSFDPGNASANGLLFGVTFSLFLLAGWEGAAPVAEESANPRRNIPRALVLSILVTGAVLVVASWGVLTGYGTSRLESFTSAEELPAFILARQYWGGAGIILLFALLNSVVVVALAITIVCTRILYAFSKAGVAPAWLAQLHPQYHSPANATIAVTAFSLVLGAVAGAALGPADSYFIYGLSLTLGLVIVYLAGNIAVGSYFRRIGEPLHLVRQVLFPVITSVALCYVLYKSVQPFPDYPVGAGVWVALGWAIVAAAYAVAVGRRAGDADIARLSESSTSGSTAE